MKVKVAIEFRHNMQWHEPGGKLVERDAYLVHPRGGGFASSTAGLSRESALDRHREHIAFLMRIQPEDVEIEVVS